MSTRKGCYVCGDIVDSNGLCAMHRKRLNRHGNPFQVKKAKCKTCIEAARIVYSKPRNRAEILDRYTSLWLLYHAGNPYLIREKDAEGDVYELDTYTVPSEDQE